MIATNVHVGFVACHIVNAVREDIEHWRFDQAYDTIIAIGLLMFFRRKTALRLVSEIKENIKPGGIAIVNTLIEGTTFMGMFDTDNYYLFAKGELKQRFSGWTIMESADQSFPAPEGTVKVFSTVVAAKPEA